MEKLALFAAVKEYEFIRNLKKRVISEISGLSYEEASEYLSLAGWKNIRSNEIAAGEELEKLLLNSLEKREVSKFDFESFMSMLRLEQNLIFHCSQDLGDGTFVEFYVVDLDGALVVYEYTTSPSQFHFYQIRS